MTVLVPCRVAGLALANRIVLAPMSRMQAQADGTPTPQMAAYYRGYAKRGVGLVMTEATYTDEEASRAYFDQPGMANERHLAGWRAVVEAVHAENRPIFLQLQHGGRLSEPGLHASAIGPSAQPAAGRSWQTGRVYAQAPVRKASAIEMEHIVNAFGAAARRAKAAGFDGVELHGARGYLLDGFLSYGGDALEARLAVPLAAVRAAREAFAGPLSFNFSLYKMDDTRYQPPGGRDEVAKIASALAAAGVDILNVTTRRCLRAEPWGATLVNTVKLAAPGTAVIANGGLQTLAECEQALAETGADLVSLARALLANPDWMRKAPAGAALASYAPGMEREALKG